MESVLFLPLLTCYVMLYSRASITKKNIQQHFLLSHSQSTSKQNHQRRVWPTALIESLAMPWQHKMPWRDARHSAQHHIRAQKRYWSTVNARQTAQQSTQMVSGTQPSSEKPGNICAQLKETFAQWSGNSLSYCLSYWFLLAALWVAPTGAGHWVKRTHEVHPYIHLSESSEYIRCPTPLKAALKTVWKSMPDFVTANGFLVRPGCSAPGGISTLQVLLSRALLQARASQKLFPIFHLPSCEANTVNSLSSLGGWKRDICGALSNCTWHMVLRCAREDGWQGMTLLWFFRLLPLSSMKIARDINAEEPEKQWNRKKETEMQALPTQCTDFKANGFAQTQDTTQASCTAADAPVPLITTAIQKKACDYELGSGRTESLIQSPCTTLGMSHHSSMLSFLNYVMKPPSMSREPTSNSQVSGNRFFSEFHTIGILSRS